MSIPTHGESFAKLIEYLRKAQEEAATLSHLRRAEGDAKGILIANGWLRISENLKKTIHIVTVIASGRLQ